MGWPRAWVACPTVWGWCLQPTVLGLGSFGGYPAALVSASTVLLWVGGPLLSVAAVGVAVHEGVRLHRNRRVRGLFSKVCKNPVIGHEEQVHQLLTQRARQVRLHGGVKLASMLGLAVGAPLLIVGFAPGAAVLTPSGVGAGWASYYLHSHLTYKPQLQASELLQLRRRDLMNRIELAQSEYLCLKELKQEKRPLFPRGGQGPLGPLARAAGGVRRWARGPVEYEAQALTVGRYLRAQAAAEEIFITNQLQLHAHAAAKAPDDPQYLADLAHLDALLHTARTRLRAVVLPAEGAEPDAPAVAAAFAQHVEVHQLSEALLHSLKKDSTRPALEAHAILLSQDETASLDLPHLRALCAADSPLSTAERTELGGAVTGLAERFLLTRNKLNVRYLRDQLLDFLAFRLDASSRADYPHSAPVAPVAPHPSEHTEPAPQSA